MDFPMDLLANISPATLEESAQNYMNKLSRSNPDTPEHLTLSDSTKVLINISSVGFVPLYGNGKQKILALFSPPNTLNAVALYLLDRWWTVEDVVKTADHTRNGVVRVKTLGERIVLYTLNRAIYRSKEMNPKEEFPFLCHGAEDFAKICWHNGEAVGFYSVKLSGSLCPSYVSKRYQLPVMDSIFVRKCHRVQGFGLQMLEDFVVSFPEDCLGLRYPLTKAMYKVCEKYLRQYPDDADLLWEAESVGGPKQRTNIANKLQSMDLSLVSRNLSFTEELCGITEVTEVESETVECRVEITEETTALTVTKGKPKAVSEADQVPVTVRGRSSGSKTRMGDNITEDKSENIIRIEDIEAEIQEKPDAAEVFVTELVQIESMLSVVTEEKEGHEDDTVPEETTDKPATVLISQDVEAAEDTPTAAAEACQEEDDGSQDLNTCELHMTVENVTQIEGKECQEDDTGVLVACEDVPVLDKDAETLDDEEETTQVEVTTEASELMHSEGGGATKRGRAVGKTTKAAPSETPRRRSQRKSRTQEAAMKEPTAQDGGRVLRGKTVNKICDMEEESEAPAAETTEEEAESEEADEIPATKPGVELAEDNVEQPKSADAENQQQPVMEKGGQELLDSQEDTPTLINEDEVVTADKAEDFDDEVEEPPVVDLKGRRKVSSKTKPSRRPQQQEEKVSASKDTQKPVEELCQVEQEQTNDHTEEEEAAETLTAVEEVGAQRAGDEKASPSTEVDVEDTMDVQEEEKTKGETEPVVADDSQDGASVQEPDTVSAALAEVFPDTNETVTPSLQGLQQQDIDISRLQNATVILVDLKTTSHDFSVKETEETPANEEKMEEEAAEEQTPTPEETIAETSPNTPAEAEMGEPENDNRGKEKEETTSEAENEEQVSVIKTRVLRSGRTTCKENHKSTRKSRQQEEEDQAGADALEEKLSQTEDGGAELEGEAEAVAPAEEISAETLAPPEEDVGEDGEKNLPQAESGEDPQKEVASDEESVDETDVVPETAVELVHEGEPEPGAAQPEVDSAALAVEQQSEEPSPQLSDLQRVSVVLFDVKKSIENVQEKTALVEEMKDEQMEEVPASPLMAGGAEQDGVEDAVNHQQEAEGSAEETSTRDQSADKGDGPPVIKTRSQKLGETSKATPRRKSARNRGDVCQQEAEASSENSEEESAVHVRVLRRGKKALAVTPRRAGKRNGKQLEEQEEQEEPTVAQESKEEEGAQKHQRTTDQEEEEDKTPQVDSTEPQMVVEAHAVKQADGPEQEEADDFLAGGDGKTSEETTTHGAAEDTPKEIQTSSASEEEEASAETDKDTKVEGEEVAAQESMGEDEPRTQTRVLRRGSKSAPAAPRRKSKRTGTQLDAEQEEEEEVSTAEEEVQEEQTQEVLEEAQDQKEKTGRDEAKESTTAPEREAAAEESQTAAASETEEQVESTEAASSTDEGKVSNQDEMPDTVETRVLRRGRKSVPAAPRRKSKRARTHVQTEEEEEESTAEEEVREEQGQEVLEEAPEKDRDNETKGNEEEFPAKGAMVQETEVQMVIKGGAAEESTEAEVLDAASETLTEEQLETPVEESTGEASSTAEGKVSNQEDTLVVETVETRVLRRGRKSAPAAPRRKSKRARTQLEAEEEEEEEEEESTAEEEVREERTQEVLEEAQDKDREKKTEGNEAEESATTPREENTELEENEAAADVSTTETQANETVETSVGGGAEETSTEEGKVSNEEETAVESPAVEKQVLRRGRKSAPAGPRRKSKRARAAADPEEEEELESAEDETADVPEKEESKEGEDVEEAVGLEKGDRCEVTVPEKIQQEETRVVQAEAAANAEDDAQHEEQAPPVTTRNLRSKTRTSQRTTTHQEQADTEKVQKGSQLPEKQAGADEPSSISMEATVAQAEEGDHPVEEMDVAIEDQGPDDATEKEAEENAENNMAAGSLKLVLDADEEPAELQQEDTQSLSEEEQEEEEPVVIGKRVLRGRTVPSVTLTPRSKAAKHHEEDKPEEQEPERSPKKRSPRKRRSSELTAARKSKRHSKV